MVNQIAITKPPKSSLSIAIPEANDSSEVLPTQAIVNGEENLAPSSEKKRDKNLNCNAPRTGGMKTGTHLGQTGSTKNIFLNKF